MNFESTKESDGERNVKATPGLDEASKKTRADRAAEEGKRVNERALFTSILLHHLDSSAT
jgi:hypothetical protein